MNALRDFPIKSMVLLISVMSLLPFGTIWVGREMYLPFLLEANTQTTQAIIFTWGAGFGLIGGGFAAVALLQPSMTKAILNFNTYFETLAYPLNPEDEPEQEVSE